MKSILILLLFASVSSFAGSDKRTCIPVAEIAGAYNPAPLWMTCGDGRSGHVLGDAQLDAVKIAVLNLATRQQTEVTLNKPAGVLVNYLPSRLAQNAFVVKFLKKQKIFLSEYVILDLIAVKFASDPKLFLDSVAVTPIK